MTYGPLDLLATCHVMKIRVGLSPPGELVIDAPEGGLSPNLLDRLRASKGDLLAALEAIEERAAIMEFDGGQCRDDAELAAWELLRAKGG